MQVDPTLTRADRLVGQVLGQVGALPDVYSELEINFFLLRRLLGVRSKEGEKQGKVGLVEGHGGVVVVVHGGLRGSRGRREGWGRSGLGRRPQEAMTCVPWGLQGAARRCGWPGRRLAGVRCTKSAPPYPRHTRIALFHPPPDYQDEQGRGAPAHSLHSPIP